MTYQIYRTNGNLLTTIPDGTANTTSTPLTLPGRSYPGYGQVFDTNFVHQLENFANTTPPINPIQGQFWFNTTDNSLYVCPQDGITNAAQWLPVILTDVYGNVSIQNLTVLNNAFITTQVQSALFIGSGANLTNLPGANVIGTVPLAAVASTANTVAGVNVTGTVANAIHALNAGLADVANTVVGANVTGTVANAIHALNAGTADIANSVSAANVVGNVGNAAYSTAAGYSSTAITVTANSQPNINILTSLTTISTGANTTPGTITGTWSLTPGSTLIATYADLAEFYEADHEYEPGTVLEFGGEKEVTLAKYTTNRVAGVVSTNPAYVMNASCPGIAVAIALQGRVPCKVRGNIKKGDMLVSAGNGSAHAATDPAIGTVIGKSLQDHTGEGIIEVAIGRL